MLTTLDAFAPLRAIAGTDFESYLALNAPWGTVGLWDLSAATGECRGGVTLIDSRRGLGFSPHRQSRTRPWISQWPGTAEGSAPATLWVREQADCSGNVVILPRLLTRARLAVPRAEVWTSSSPTRNESDGALFWRLVRNSASPLIQTGFRAAGRAAAVV